VKSGPFCFFVSAALDAAITNKDEQLFDKWVLLEKLDRFL